METSVIHDLRWLDDGDHVGYLCQHIDELVEVILTLIEARIDQRKKIICLINNCIRLIEKPNCKGATFVIRFNQKQ